MVLLTIHRSRGTAAAFTLGPLLTGTAQAVTPQEQLAPFSAAAGAAVRGRGCLLSEKAGVLAWLLSIQR